MALRVGLSDYFHGLQYEFGNSMCITDDGVIVATINDKVTHAYDGYIVLQRETGNVASEFRYSRKTNGLPALAAVKGITVSGVAASNTAGLSVDLSDGTNSTTVSVAIPEDTTAQAAAQMLAAAIDADATARIIVKVTYTSDNPETIYLTSATPGVDFNLQAVSLDTAATTPKATANLTQPAGPTVQTALTAPTVVGSNELNVVSTVGFAPGQEIVVKPTTGAESKFVIQTVDDVNNIIKVTVALTTAYPVDTVIQAVKGIVVDSVDGFGPGVDIYIVEGSINEAVRIKSLDSVSKTIYTETSLVNTYTDAAIIQTVAQDAAQQQVATTTYIENQVEIPADTPETDVICFDYSRVHKAIFCFRKADKRLLRLDPYNAVTKPVGLPTFSAVAGNIVDIHISNDVIYILDDRNSVYKFNLDTGTLLDRFVIHTNYKLRSLTGANYILYDRYTVNADEPERVALDINRLYLLCEKNRVLVYDLNLRRIILQTTITSDVEVKAIDFYRTFQASEDASILKDFTGTTQTAESYDAAFLFSLADGMSNNEWVNRWQYNLFKYVPTTIMMVSGNAIITPNGTISIYARGLSDQGEVVDDLPIKFTVAGNAGGTIVKPAGGAYTYPANRDGWVAAMYQASSAPPVGSSDTITAVLIT